MCVQYIAVNIYDCTSIGVKKWRLSPRVIHVQLSVTYQAALARKSPPPQKSFSCYTFDVKRHRTVKVHMYSHKLNMTALPTPYFMQIFDKRPYIAATNDMQVKSAHSWRLEML